MIFYTPSTAHLASSIALPQGAVTFKRFSDQELYVQILESQRSIQEPVWVVAATPPPAENLFAFFFLLDALQRLGISPFILITYFGYARQDRAQFGESLSCQVISNFLKTFTFKKLIVIHIHNTLVRKFISFDSLIPYNFFCSYAQTADIIVAPDRGAFDLASTIAQKTGKFAVYIEKIREHEHHDQSKAVSISGPVEGKKVLIVDDMISTGTTIINAAHILYQQGATRVDVAATHGIFSGNALTMLQESPIKTIAVTNTLAQQQRASRIQVIDIGPFLHHIIQEF